MKVHFYQMMCLLGCLFLAMSGAYAQSVVSGQVTSSEDGSALPGVNVIVKGSSSGTVTDIEGNYRLSVPPDGSILTFSFIGFQSQDVEIGNQSTVSVALLPDTRQLSEVVVTAIGIEREERALGYSVETLQGEKIQQVSEPDPLRALQGKVPGVNISGSTGAPGSATRITIRGQSSFLGNNEPLYVVDGTPYFAEQFDTYNQLTGGASYASPLAALDPNAIESISVLKGAAAASLYGSRAANGVVVITTKAGSPNLSKKGLEVTFSSSYSVEQIGNLPEYQNLYGNGTEFQYRPGSNGSWGAAFAWFDSVEVWQNYKTAYPDLFTDSIPYVAQPNNVEDLFRNGHVWDNSITIQGGSGNTSFSLTASHLENEGYIPEANFTRTSLSVGAQTTLENGLRAGGNLSYSVSEQNGPIFGSSGAADPGAASSFARTLWLGRTWNMDLPFETPSGASLFFTSQDNPIWSWRNNGITSNLDRITANANLGYDITDWLSVDYRIGINQFTDRRQQVWNEGSVAFGGSGAIVDDDIYRQEIESNFIITVERDLSESLYFKGLIGHNINQRKEDRQQNQGVDIIAPGIFDLDNTVNVTATGQGNFEQRRLMGIYSDITLGYNDYVYFNLTGRTDWSSTLPEDQRNYFYGSASASVIFTEWLQTNESLFSQGKLRLSVARVGNDADPYQLTNLFSINRGSNTNLIGSVPDNDLPFNGQPGITRDPTAFDPNLSPEFTDEFEVGTTLDFFLGRVVLDFTYYNRVTRDQIVNISVPETSGFQRLVTNAGSMENRGIEVGLNLVPIQLNNGLRWDIYTAFTRNRNEVLEIPDGLDRFNVRNLFGGGVTPVIEPGEPYGILRGSVSARDDEGNLLIDPATGVLFPALEFDKIGDPNPDFLLGITNTVSFRGFTISALIDYRHGGDIYSTTIERLLGRGVTRDTEDRDASRVIPGFLGDPNTGQPILDENGNKIPNTIQVSTNDLYFQNGNGSFGINAEDEWTVYDGTVIRLREASVGYTLPQSLLERTPFGRVTLTLTGRNLWYNAPNTPEYTNFDPEVNGFGSTNTQGIEYASAPTTRRFGVNLNVTF
ncbi:SusC/RagA family TonB-linked outer membrane protein [Tunicatimonas pelagia]|uniref:SusC/RagA family TonB-linked outer membrane protein n=1 Tax=Tunicatimonas pelagia TaxID=931531 RepID=UPI0026658B3E|nr:SusC/RagA family TonB-linked outer membrane protein [Tunicatimonas pelagia]WKN41755.1 SusC/RagA family TonB-linked outer membrane protein [Tunicatimonas pelagia]